MRPLTVYLAHPLRSSVVYPVITSIRTATYWDPLLNKSSVITSTQVRPPAMPSRSSTMSPRKLSSPAKPRRITCALKDNADAITTVADYPRCYHHNGSRYRSPSRRRGRTRIHFIPKSDALDPAEGATIKLSRRFLSTCSLWALSWRSPTTHGHDVRRDEHRLDKGISPARWPINRQTSPRVSDTLREEGIVAPSHVQANHPGQSGAGRDSALPCLHCPRLKNCS